MPRTARASRAGACYHVVTRGNARQTTFHDDEDFNRFSHLLGRARVERPTTLLAWCLMPNHVHLVLRPQADGALGRWMHWLLTTHVRYHQRRYASVGRIWQGRFKAFPIQEDSHLLTVMRYVERNPVRAGLVRHATAWRWSSMALRDRITGDPLVPNGLLTRSPVALPSPWTEWVDEPLTEPELSALRECVRRDRPFGERAWVHGTADRLGLRSTLNPVGRPRAKV